MFVFARCCGLSFVARCLLFVVKRLPNVVVVCCSLLTFVVRCSSLLFVGVVLLVVLVFVACSSLLVVGWSLLLCVLFVDVARRRRCSLFVVRC